MTHPGQPTESARRYATIDPKLREEFDQAYGLLIAPHLAGATNPFTAELGGAQALLDQARRGFVPLAGYDTDGIYLRPPADDAGIPAVSGAGTTPYRTVWARIPPERRPLLLLGLILLIGLGGVLVTAPGRETPQNAGKPGFRAHMAAAQAVNATATATAASPAAAPITSTQTISTTDPAYPAPDNSAFQNMVPDVARASLLMPVSLELDGKSGQHIYRVVASSPTKDGTWHPQIPEGRTAWLNGTVVNQVFCLPAATLPAVQAGDTILVRTRSGAPLRYSITAVRADVGWQQTEVLSQRRNGVTVLGCGGPQTAPRHAWFATFRIEDQPETPAAQPPVSATPAAPAPLDVAAIAAHVMADPMKPGGGNVLMITLSVVNRSRQPVQLDPRAISVLDGSTGGTLPLAEGLPTTVPPSKDRQTVMVSVKPPDKGMAVLQTDARFGDRRWHLTPAPQK